MPEPETKTVPLVVDVADDAAEVFLIDGDFRLVKRGVGRQTFDVPPGIYKIKCRSGRQAFEQLVVVREGMPVVQIERVRVNSAMPLEGSLRTHEYHMAAASGAATGPSVNAGTGSGIIIVARQWTAQDPPADRAPLPNPAHGLVLRDSAGATVADVEEHTSFQGTGDPIVTLNVDLAPGDYCLTRTRPDGARVCLPLVASAGWRTHVYVLVDENGVDRDAGAELVNAAITIRRPGSAFQANDKELRDEEIARGALRDGQNILSAPVRAQFIAPDASPMLALIGAHLILCAAKKTAEKGKAGVASQTSDPHDLDDVRTIVTNLRAALGPHPDVEALASLCGSANQTYVFNNPPMLRAGWAGMLDASCKRPAAVPADSNTANVAECVWGEGPWLLWMERPTMSDVERARSWQARAREVVVTLARERRGPAIRAAAPAPASPPAHSAPAALGERVSRASEIALEGGKSAWHRVRKLVTRRDRTPFPSFNAVAQAPATAERTAGAFRVARASLTHANRAELVKEVGVPMSRIDAWLEGTAGE